MSAEANKFVPESVLKKQKTTEANKAEFEKQRAALKIVSKQITSSNTSTTHLFLQYRNVDKRELKSTKELKITQLNTTKQNVQLSAQDAKPKKEETTTSKLTQNSLLL